MSDDGTRLDRELMELFNGLRVVLPGVQVIFAFLLTIPFSSRFPRLSSTEEAVYVSALLSTTVSSILLIAPTALHRLRWRQRDKEWMLRTSNRLVIAGTGFLALSITAAVFLITELVYGLILALLVTATVAALLGVAWYALPLSRSAHEAASDRGPAREATRTR